MTNLQPIIDDLTNVRDRFAAVKLDHPWDENIRRNTVARLDAALSDLRVVACRMREDGPFNPQDYQPEREAEEQPEPAPITEDLMRRAQVGWVVRTVGGKSGKVIMEAETCFLAEFHDHDQRTYYRKNFGKYYGSSDYDIVSLSPPEPASVVADPPEIIL